nr:MAG TPA: hypothetical protein [Caudoviricetes sp.]
MKLKYVLTHTFKYVLLVLLLKLKKLGLFN